jgi:hypothetical protein
MQIYSIKKEAAMEKVRTFLSISCNYKITDKIVEEVFFS